MKQTVELIVLTALLLLFESNLNRTHFTHPVLPFLKVTVRAATYTHKETHAHTVIALLFFSTQWQEVVQISAGPLKKKERVNKVGWVVVTEGVGGSGDDGIVRLQS